MKKLGADYFNLENVPFNLAGNKRPVLVYTRDDIKKFQRVSRILSSQPRNRKDLKKAIQLAFTSGEPIIKPKEAWEDSIHTLKEELNLMRNEDQRLLMAIQEINQKLSHLEDGLKGGKEKKSRLFRSQ